MWRNKSRRRSPVTLTNVVLATSLPHAKAVSDRQPKQQKSQPDAMRQPRRQAVDKELDPVLRADRAEHRRGDGCHNDRVSAQRDRT